MGRWKGHGRRTEKGKKLTSTSEKGKSNPSQLTAGLILPVGLGVDSARCCPCCSVEPMQAAGAPTLGEVDRRPWCREKGARPLSNRFWAQQQTRSLCNHKTGQMSSVPAELITGSLPVATLAPPPFSCLLDKNDYDTPSQNCSYFQTTPNPWQMPAFWAFPPKVSQKPNSHRNPF